MAREIILNRSANWILSSGTFNKGDAVLTLPLQKSLAEWGMFDGRLQRSSIGPDILTFNSVVDKFDASPLIPFGAVVSLRDPSGVQRFVGRRLQVPQAAAGNSESHAYIFAGPWYWLEKLTYKQTWQRLLVNGQVVPQTTTHFLLNGTDRRSVGAQIRHVLEYAISQGAPFQIGNINCDVVPWVSEISDQTCAQVIIDQTRFAPDCVGWFDYTTSVPTFHLGRNNARGSVSLTFGAPGPIQIADAGLQITPRHDLVIDNVCLRYEKTDTLDGKEYLSLAKDSYPPGSDGDGLAALNSTIVLQGTKVATLKATIVCDDIDVDDLDFWRRHIPKLQDPRIRVLSKSGTVSRILQGSRSEANPNGTQSRQLPRFLIEGQLQQWMKDASDVALEWEQEEITATFDYMLVADDQQNQVTQILEVVRGAKATVQVVATTAPAGETEYFTIKSVDEGEAVPYGLAEYLYNALSGIDYEGTVSTTENECSGYIGPGHGINIAGTADAAHASMNARVQSVSEIIDQGVTSFSFGPTPGYTLSAILEFMRATRQRRRWTRENTQTDGDIGASTSGELELGQATANSNSIPGNEQNKFFACVDGENKVEIDGTNRKIKCTIQGDAKPYFEAVAELSLARSYLTAGGSYYTSLESGPTNSKVVVFGSGGKINCDSSLCNSKELFPREETWCDPSTGQRRKIMVLASVPYD